jgi:CshA-type fibril repeat protein
VTIVVVANDTTGDTVDPSTVQIVGTSNPGDPLVVPGEGTWTVDTNTGSITFTPETGFTGDPTPITYTVDDDEGNTSNPALVTITYTVAPVAVNDEDLGNTPGDRRHPRLPGQRQRLVRPHARPDQPRAGRRRHRQRRQDAHRQRRRRVDGQRHHRRSDLHPRNRLRARPGPDPIHDQGRPGQCVQPRHRDRGLHPGGQRRQLARQPDRHARDHRGGCQRHHGDTVDPTTVQIVGTSNPGDPLVVPGEGTWTVDPVTGSITFTPETGFTGDPTPITYTVDDDEGNTSNPALVTITYTVAPVAVNDEDLGNTPAPGHPRLPGQRHASAGRTLDLTSVEIAGAPGNGKTLVVPGEGTWTVDATTGEVTFTPETGFVLDPAPIQYTIKDDQGNVSNLATVTVDYIPVATDDSSLGNPIGTPVTIPVVANDTTGDTVDPSTVQIVGTSTRRSAGTGSRRRHLDGGPGHRFDHLHPETGFTGDPTPITYTVEDDEGNTSNPALVTITYTVGPGRRERRGPRQHPAPPSPSTPRPTTRASAGRTLDLTSVEIAGAPGSGKTLVVPGEGTWTVDATTGEVTFTPESGFVLDPAPIQYTIKDDQGNVSNLATVTVDYIPVASDDSSLGNPIGTPVTIVVVANDTTGDTVDPTTVQIVGTSNPGDPQGEVPGEGTWTVDPVTGAITFTPETGFTGDPTPITYTVDDDEGNTSNPALVTITYTVGPGRRQRRGPRQHPGTAVTLDSPANDSASAGRTLDLTSVELAGADRQRQDARGSRRRRLDGGRHHRRSHLHPRNRLRARPGPDPIHDQGRPGQRVQPRHGDRGLHPGGQRRQLAGQPDRHARDHRGGCQRHHRRHGRSDHRANRRHLQPGDGWWFPAKAPGRWIPVTGAITFTPETGFTGDPTPITYTVEDDEGNTSNPALVTITYTVAPLAANDEDLGNTPGDPVTLDSPANDSASAGRTLDLTSLELAGADSGSGGKTLTVTGEGVWTVNATTGEVTFTPESGFVLDPAPVQYTIKDDQGNLSNLATVTVDYIPVASDDSSLGNPIGQPVTIP